MWIELLPLRVRPNKKVFKPSQSRSFFTQQTSSLSTSFLFLRLLNPRKLSTMNNKVASLVICFVVLVMFASQSEAAFGYIPSGKKRSVVTSGLSNMQEDLARNICSAARNIGCCQLGAWNDETKESNTH